MNLYCTCKSSSAHWNRCQMRFKTQFSCASILAVKIRTICKRTNYDCCPTYSFLQIKFKRLLSEIFPLVRSCLRAVKTTLTKANGNSKCFGNFGNVILQILHCCLVPCNSLKRGLDESAGSFRLFRQWWQNAPEQMKTFFVCQILSSKKSPLRVLRDVSVVKHWLTVMRWSLRWNFVSPRKFLGPRYVVSLRRVQFHFRARVYRNREVKKFALPSFNDFAETGFSI